MSQKVINSRCEISFEIKQCPSSALEPGHWTLEGCSITLKWFNYLKGTVQYVLAQTLTPATWKYWVYQKIYLLYCIIWAYSKVNLYPNSLRPFYRTVTRALDKCCELLWVYAHSDRQSVFGENCQNSHSSELNEWPAVIHSLWSSDRRQNAQEKKQRHELPEQ